MEANQSHNPLLNRIAFKMATGAGKTVVMAMLIAWHTLNKLASPQDNRFGDAFLIVTPGITIKDRLRVLLPTDPDNYYRKFGLAPEDVRERLAHAKIIVTNYHAFLPREKVAVGKLTKQVLGNGRGGAFTESPDEVVRRVCRSLGNKKGVIVINDEAHHCYRGKPETDGEKLKGDERKEAEKRAQTARVWITGLESVKRKLGLRAVYDLSATPFFLKGSGYREGTLFPWVVSDFSLIDAIESGIVKVPRVPVADNTMTGLQPTYRDIWVRIKDHLPKKGRGTDAVTGEPKLPAELEGALQSLYGNYCLYYKMWQQDPAAGLRGATPPVFIVVCNNTNVSKLVFDYIAGWEKKLPDGSTVLVPGKLELFSNVADRRWVARPQQTGRRGHPARSHEHRGQARQVGRAGAVRGFGLDADRRMGREHGYAHPGHPRLWHPTALRAGSGPRPAAAQFCPHRGRPLRTGVRRGLRRALFLHSDRRLHGYAAPAETRHARASA
jgi:type III restriction enzyme